MILTLRHNDEFIIKVMIQEWISAMTDMDLDRLMWYTNDEIRRRKLDKLLNKLIEKENNLKNRGVS